ncbi:hypothetical protein VSX64_04945 [Aurantimonas sp. C2-6-R+9]|uniref:hypothetical protein n=1 Tax=unclassified Aurantimonas TaxID=2638230 RepID=UPI002E19E9BB|nr:MULTISPECIES: hypothetical protein [unclassified Aurantimonas]MEC5290121.1 hypothetical protein [Aurantimonas sp. C2-3-R2]MEC5380234.1 hypothetical protein [Aurantimonas sp. C2-6-R+9]MEC5411185.1 hypothetical protein [Aurantimonas sp. C2-4-R8]
MSTLEALGKVAGIGGIALGVMALVYLRAVGPNIGGLSRENAFRLLRTMMILSFLVAIGGLAAWTWTATRLAAQEEALTECVARLAANRSNAVSPSPPPLISAGRNIQAAGDIRIEGADRLALAAMRAECGDVIAGGIIDVEAKGDDARAR